MFYDIFPRTQRKENSKNVWTLCPAFWEARYLSICIYSSWFAAIILICWSWKIPRTPYEFQFVTLPLSLRMLSCIPEQQAINSWGMHFLIF